MTIARVSLFDRLQADLVDARRRRDEASLTTLGLLKSEIVRASKEPGASAAMEDDLVLRVARREVKKRQEAIDVYRKAGREESATWLGRKGIGMFGVEAVSPGRPGRNNFEVHHVCRDLGFTHMEGLVNLDKLVGKGRFRFIGFPIKIKGGTGAPIRAVAWLDG